MEYGAIPKLNQFVENNTTEIQRIQTSTESSDIKDKDELKQIQQELINSEKKTSETNEIKDKSISSKYEVLLSNMNFGYNESSKDFFVKVERGNIENQYPTAEMMKIKAYMLSLNESE